eukprot:g82049.t1
MEWNGSAATIFSFELLKTWRLNLRRKSQHSRLQRNLNITTVDSFDIFQVLILSVPWILRFKLFLLPSHDSFSEVDDEYTIRLSHDHLHTMSTEALKHCDSSFETTATSARLSLCSPLNSCTYC